MLLLIKLNLFYKSKLFLYCKLNFLKIFLRIKECVTEILQEKTLGKNVGKKRLKK